MHCQHFLFQRPLQTSIIKAVSKWTIPRTTPSRSLGYLPLLLDRRRKRTWCGRGKRRRRCAKAVRFDLGLGAAFHEVMIGQIDFTPSIYILSSVKVQFANNQSFCLLPFHWVHSLEGCQGSPICLLKWQPALGCSERWKYGHLMTV